MNTIELAIAEEATVETTEQQTRDLSLPELDMVGGGSSTSILE